MSSVKWQLFCLGLNVLSTKRIPREFTRGCKNLTSRMNLRKGRAVELAPDPGMNK